MAAKAAARQRVVSGYDALSLWPCEDGGPQRLQVVPRQLAGPAGSGHWQASSRRTLMSTMVLAGRPGELFLMTHSAIRANFGLPTSAQIERIDPKTLRTEVRSERLPGGPMWPGGMALHANGDLYVAYGRWLHRLNRDGLRIKAALKLPVNEPHNSLVILDNGMLVTKNLSRTTPARLNLIDPETMRAVGPATIADEPSVARLSARGSSVWMVGCESLMRFDLAGDRLVADPQWRCDYRAGSGRTHGWDVVLGERHAWFMDNGEHRYRTHMVGRGVAGSSNRLIRVSLTDASDWQALEVSGMAGGSITNPPLWDESRQIIVSFDSANRVMRAWHFAEELRGLEPLWRREMLGVASHMLLWPKAGVIAANDWDGREHVVLIDISTGETLTRVATGGRMQGVVFPSPGWAGDLYWCSMDRVSRISPA